MLYCVYHVYGGLARETHNFIAFVHRYVSVDVSDGGIRRRYPRRVIRTS